MFFFKSTEFSAFEKHHFTDETLNLTLHKFVKIHSNIKILFTKDYMVPASALLCACMSFDALSLLVVCVVRAFNMLNGFKYDHVQCTAKQQWNQHDAKACHQ